MSILVERLSTWTIELAPDTDARVGRLISPVPLASLLEDDANAGMVVAAWAATREHKFENDPLAWALLFAALRDRFAIERIDLAEALRAQGMNFPRTRLEIHLQGGARLYQFGMDLLHEGPDAAAGRLVLQEAMATYELVESGEAILNDRQRRTFRGMRGVGRLALARQDSDPGPLLEAAIVDLEISEALGDHTAPHFAFLTESYLRRFDLTGALDLLSQAEQAVARGIAHNTAGRAAVLARADCSTRRGFQLSINGDHGAALSAFGVALADYSLALSMLAGKKGTSDEFVRVRQGQIRFQLYCSRLKLNGTKDTKYSIAPSTICASSRRCRPWSAARWPEHCCVARRSPRTTVTGCRRWRMPLKPPSTASVTVLATWSCATRPKPRSRRAKCGWVSNSMMCPDPPRLRAAPRASRRRLRLDRRAEPRSPPARP